MNTVIENINRIELVGRIGNVSVTKVGDTEVVRMSVATTYGYTNIDKEKVYETTWHNVTAWKGEKVTEDTMHKLKKGVDVRVVGRLRAYRFVNADGSEVRGYEVVAHEIEIVQE